MNYYRVEGKLCCAFEDGLPFEKTVAPEKEEVLREGMNFLFSRPEAECRASFLVNDPDFLFQKQEDVSWLNKNKISGEAEQAGGKELVDELVHTDITSTFKGLAENSRKTKPKAVHYDEVDLEQISLFDTVQDQDIIEELKNLDITMLTPMDAMNTLYRLQNKLKNRW